MQLFLFRIWLSPCSENMNELASLFKPLQVDQANTKDESMDTVIVSHVFVTSVFFSPSDHSLAHVPCVRGKKVYTYCSAPPICTCDYLECHECIFIFNGIHYSFIVQYAEIFRIGSNNSVTY